MKHVFGMLGLIAIVVITGCTTARRISTLAMPDPLVKTLPPVDVTPYLSLAGVYDGVYLDHESIIEHSGIKEDAGGLVAKLWEYSQISKKRYIVLNPSAQWLTTFEIGFKPDKLYLRSTSPRGEVHTYGSADLQEVKAGAKDVDYKFAFPHVERGTVIEIGYEWSYAVSVFVPPLEYEEWFQFIIPCERVSFQFSCPNWWNIAIKENAPAARVPVTMRQDTANRKIIMSYEAVKVPAYKLERFSPPASEYAPHLAFRVTDVYIGGQNLKVSQSWDDVIDRLFKYGLANAETSQDFTQKRRHSAELPKQVRLVADSLAATALTTLDTIQAVNKFVSSTIKLDYPGHGGNAGETLAKKQGDIFDICSLTMTLLDLLQRPTNLVLLHDRSEGPFDRAYVSLDQLSAPAVRIMIDSVGYLLFPWVKNLPVGVVPPPFQGQQAMVLGDRSIHSMWVVPYDSAGANRVEHEVVASIDSTGIIRACTRLEMRGGNAYGFRHALEELPGDKAEDSLRSWIMPNSANIRFDSLVMKSDSDYYRPLVVKLYYAIPNAVAITPEETVVQIEDLVAPIWDYRLSNDSADRTNDIDISFNQKYRQTVTLTVPSGWSLVSSLPEQHADTRFGTLERTSYSHQDSVVINRTITLKCAHETKERIGELEELVGRRSMADVSVLVFASPRP